MMQSILVVIGIVLGVNLLAAVIAGAFGIDDDLVARVLYAGTVGYLVARVVETGSFFG